MPDWLSKETLAAWWAVVTAAPHLSLALIILCFSAGFMFARSLYIGRIGTLEERLKLKDDVAAEYKRKLDGATPDEAKTRLDALEKLVGHLRPRDLTQRQRLAIASALERQPQGSRVEVGYDMTDRVSESYAEQLCDLFLSCGWPISKNAVMATWGRNFPGLAVIHRPEPDTPALQALLEGFNRAGIAFIRISNPVDAQYVCRLSVGPVGASSSQA